MAEQAVGDAVERPQPRRWLAVLLTFVSPGLGHAYAGELLRAAATKGTQGEDQVFYHQAVGAS